MIPAPRRPVSNTLFIDGFVRPLMVKQVREILQKYGEIVLLWMNSIKSQAYVTVLSFIGFYLILNSSALWRRQLLAERLCMDMNGSLELLFQYVTILCELIHSQIDYSTQVLAQQVATRAAGAPGSITAAEVKELLKNQPKEEDSVKVVEQQEPSKDLTNDKAEPPRTCVVLF